MRIFKQFEHKSLPVSAPAKTTMSFLQPSRSFVPFSTFQQFSSPVGREQLDHATRFGHSLARVPLFPQNRLFTDAMPEGIQRKIPITETVSPKMPREETVSVIKQTAQEGIQTPSTALPFIERIRQSFGRHDISQIQAHLGLDASMSASAIQASAYAMGNHVVFAGRPDLRTVAHEATHVIQQQSGVQLAGGVGSVGDIYEQHADLVAERVHLGHSAEDLLNRFVGERFKTCCTSQDVQQKYEPVLDMSSNPYVSYYANMQVQRTYHDYKGEGVGDNIDIYRTQDFSYKTNMRQRPDTVKVHVFSHGGKKPGPPDAMSFLDANQTTMSDQDQADFGGYHRGHVIAHTLGGDNYSYNIVPMKASFNTGPWKKIENKVLSQVKVPGSGGGNYLMTVKMSYAGMDSRVPDNFVVRGDHYDSFKKIWKNDIPETILSHKVDEINVPSETQKRIKEDLGSLKGTNKKDIFEQAAANFLNLIVKFDRLYEGSDKEEANAKAKHLREMHHLPAIGRLYPAEPMYRPYEELDILYLAGKLNITMQQSFTTGDFTDEQIKLILQVNATRNGGVLKSDASNDPHQNLSLDGVKNHPEVDHIIPAGKGGTNWFSNARVVSWEMNNKQERMKNPNLFIEPSSIKLESVMRLKDAVYLIVLKHDLKYGGSMTPDNVVTELKNLIGKRHSKAIKSGRNILSKKDIKVAEVRLIMDDLLPGYLVLNKGKYTAHRPASYRSK